MLSTDRRLLLAAVLFSGMGVEHKIVYAATIMQADDGALLRFLKRRLALYPTPPPDRSRPTPAHWSRRWVRRKAVGEPSPWQEYAVRVMEDCQV